MTGPCRANLAPNVAVLIATQLRHEASTISGVSAEFARGVAHAALIVERIAAAIGRTQ